MEYILSNMETNRLIHFRTVVDAGGLMKASELLGITGGGLSKSIKALEEELGFKLFIQNGRNLELTELGTIFYQKLPEAQKVLDELINVHKTVISSSNKKLRFATFEVFSTYFLPRFINNLHQDLNFEIREAIPGEMEKFISNNHADIGITYEPIPTKGIEFLKTGKLRMGIFSSNQNLVEKYSLETVPFAVPINPIEGAPSGVKGLDGWPNHKYERNEKFRVEMMETALQLSSQGNCVTFIPSFIADFFNQQAKASNKLYELKFQGSPKLSRNVFIIVRKNYEENSTIKKLARDLRSLS